MRSSKPPIFSNITRNRRHQNSQSKSSSSSSKSREKWTYLILLAGCIALMFVADQLVQSNHSLDILKSSLYKLSLKGQVSQAVAPILVKTSKYIHQIQGSKESYPLPDIISKQSNINVRNGDDAQPSWPTQAPTLPSKDDIEAYFAATNTYPDEKYIQLMPSKRLGIRQDRRVVFGEDFVDLFHSYSRPPGPPSGIPGRPRALTAAEDALRNAPYNQLFSQYSNAKKRFPLSLVEAVVLIQTSPQCVDKPVFLSMATVKEDLYWQLIENFVYTMVKYNVSDCSLVICVSDPRCMEMCALSYFPCYNYQSEAVRKALAAGKDENSAAALMPSVMEQIAEVKLLHIPKALTNNVSVFMLDLDVGFLADPMIMVKTFFATPRMDIFVQEDMIFVMNRSVAGWKTWTVEPLPNIGLFLCRGNNKTARVFEIAWKRYNKYTDDEMKQNPGKDQNHVLEGMRHSRANIGLRYAYFSNYTAILMDKYVRLTDPSAELGGEATAIPMLQRKSITVHMTCYEKSTKVMGLKATNAFWNPKYYDPLRRTITKSLIFISEKQLLDEVRSLIWLGLRTDRAVIVPNILGADDMTVAPYSANKLKMWPGFRVIKFKRSDGRNQLKVDVLEPGFYWRVQRDYDEAPIPKVLFFNPDRDSLEAIRMKLEEYDYKNYPRIVLYPEIPSSSLRNHHLRKEARNSHLSFGAISLIDRAIRWANDSVGWFESGFSDEITRYGSIPSVKDIRNELQAEATLNGMRTCARIFVPMKGNRSCFQICD